MILIEQLKETIEINFSGGDREIRTWFLVQENFLPFILCGLYALFSTVIGPALMKNRKPFKLRIPMIIFNLFLVAGYTTSLFIIFTNLPKLSMQTFCKGGNVQKGDLTYKLTRCCWFLYILKYIEFIDTVFFILRKKNHLITFLHVFHHTIVPILGWTILRTEKSGFQTIPVLLNGCVHIIMYSYYGLAAIGPHMKKYLWWKKYLTMIQMTQFALIVMFVLVIAPLTGCTIVKASIMMDIVFGLMFLLLFYNFYTTSFKSSKCASTDCDTMPQKKYT